MNTPEPAREVRVKTISAARNAARRATIDLALQDGARVISRPALPGAQNVIRDVEPIAGMRAAREIELGARYHTRTYIRDAREAGRTWHEIGRALGLVPGGEADKQARRSPRRPTPTRPATPIARRPGATAGRSRGGAGHARD